MSVKKRKYSSEFKAKVVMNLISGDQTMAQICSKYQVSDKSVTAWKKKFFIERQYGIRYRPCGI